MAKNYPEILLFEICFFFQHFDFSLFVFISVVGHAFEPSLEQHTSGNGGEEHKGNWVALMQTESRNDHADTKDKVRVAGCNEGRWGIC